MYYTSTVLVLSQNLSYAHFVTFTLPRYEQLSHSSSFVGLVSCYLTHYHTRVCDRPSLIMLQHTSLLRYDNQSISRSYSSLSSCSTTSEITHSRYLAVILIRLKSSISDTQHSSIRLKSNIPDTRHRNILRTGTSNFKGCLLMMYRMSLTFLAVHQCSRCLRFHVAIV